MSRFVHGADRRQQTLLAELIASYLEDLDTADRHEGDGVEARSVRLVEKIDRLRAQMAMLKAMEAKIEASPDGQVSLTDPDARAMATSGRGSGIVGYNVQSAVEGEHHLIVAHEVVMTGSDRQQLASMAEATICCAHVRGALKRRRLLPAVEPMSSVGACEA